MAAGWAVPMALLGLLIACVCVDRFWASCRRVYRRRTTGRADGFVPVHVLSQEDNSDLDEDDRLMLQGESLDSNEMMEFSEISLGRLEEAGDAQAGI